MPVLVKNNKPISNFRGWKYFLCKKFNSLKWIFFKHFLSQVAVLWRQRFLFNFFTSYLFDVVFVVQHQEQWIALKSKVLKSGCQRHEHKNNFWIPLKMKNREAPWKSWQPKKRGANAVTYTVGIQELEIFCTIFKT